MELNHKKNAACPIASSSTMEEPKETKGLTPAAAAGDVKIQTKPIVKKTTPKIGQWTLNKSQLKKLGIESSVLNALTKLKGTKSNGKNMRIVYLMFYFKKLQYFIHLWIFL